MRKRPDPEYDMRNITPPLSNTGQVEPFFQSPILQFFITVSLLQVATMQTEVSTKMSSPITRVPVPGTETAPPPYTAESRSPSQAAPQIERIDTRSTPSISTSIPRRQVRPTSPPLPSLPSFSPFSIATDNDALSSGFPYVPRLLELNITRDQWNLFSTQVLHAAKLTAAEDALAWSTGITTGTLLAAIIIGPVVGYYAGKSIHARTVKKKVKAKLAQDEGDLISVLRLWNTGVFKERGIQASLEPPVRTNEVSVDLGPSATQKDIEREAKRVARRFRIVLSPFEADSYIDSDSNQDQALSVPIPLVHPALRRARSDWSPVSPESGPNTPVQRQSPYMHRQNTDPDPEEPRTEYPPEKTGFPAEMSSDQLTIHELDAEPSSSSSREVGSGVT